MCTGFTGTIWFKRHRVMLATICAIVLLLASTRVRKVMAQMVSTGAKDRPGLPLLPGMKAPVADFRDLAPEAGLNAVIVSGEFKQTYLVEGTGTGVALFDYDNDGLLDIFLVNADHIKPLSPPPTVHLYHNLGGLRFEDVTENAGLGHTGWGQGVCAGDFDNDGFVICLSVSGDTTCCCTIWAMGGSATRRRSAVWTGSSRAGARAARLSTMTATAISISWWRTISTWIPEVSKLGDPEPCNWRGLPVPCGPRGQKGETMSLYHNNGHGHFSDVSKQAGVEGPRKYYGFTVLTGDFDNDGWPDFYVTCDSTPSLLFRNNHHGSV